MTANNYAALATQARQLAGQAKPDPADPCANSLALAETYLNMAATKLQATAEFYAEKDRTHAAK